MTDAERKKLLSKNVVGFGLVLQLGILEDLFCNTLFAILYPSLTQHTLKNLPVFSAYELARFWAVIVSIFACVWWGKAIKRALSPNPSPEDIETGRRRIQSVYRDAYILIGIYVLAHLIVYAFYPGLPWGDIFAVLLPMLAIVLFAVIGQMLVFVDQFLAWAEKAMSVFYAPDELFVVRGGVSISLVAKITLLVVPLAIFPLWFFFLVWMVKAKLDVLDLWLLPAYSTITLTGFLWMLLKKVQRPINGLIDKMERLSAGDYSVKTHIYFSDEIARLKAGFNKMADGLREREEMRSTFGKYVSPEIARELLKNHRVNLGGQEVDAAVLFCDIRNFTPLSGGLSAPETVAFLNEYFSYITPPIMEHGGVINKFMGDGVMAIYVPALGSTAYAADAVRSALGMRAALERFNASGKYPPVRFGVGIHAGKLVAGNIGTASRLEYTFIGDTVNIASRIESATKEAGTDILVSGAVTDKAGGLLGKAVRFEKAGPFQLKGRAEPLELHKVAACQP